ncbi:MAG TPA: metallophosphoesterase [Methanocella sp.]|nr:metallophosphoesterase [Methanocella sp.]
MSGSILLVSDVHADIQALDDILAIAYSGDFSKRYGPLKKILNLGDLLERGYHPREVVERLKKLNVESVIGNHEEAFLFSRPISTPDAKSLVAHRDYRASGEYGDFFEGMPKTIIDRSMLLFAAHGGPLDQSSLVSANVGDGAWTFSPTWQRISEAGRSYAASDGYHYLPDEAFAEVKAVFKRDGFIIVCGHDHKEVVYRQKNGVVNNVLAGLEEHIIDLGGRRVREKRLDIEDDSNYLIRIGIAGPEGYLPRGWMDRSYFGVIERKDGRRTFYLLSFDRQQRDNL